MTFLSIAVPICWEDRFRGNYGLNVSLGEVIKYNINNEWWMKSSDIEPYFDSKIIFLAAINRLRYSYCDIMQTWHVFNFSYSYLNCDNRATRNYTAWAWMRQFNIENLSASKKLRCEAHKCVFGTSLLYVTQWFGKMRWRLNG